MFRKTMYLGVLSFVLASCGGGNSSAPPVQSTGLKIFVTANKHVGDFKNDPLLQGTTAVSKADTFCNNDLNKPNSSNYKALIVDSVNRNPSNNIDWVLKANTTYYRPYDNIKIGLTTNTSIFPALFADLTNSVADRVNSTSSDTSLLSNAAWTGILDAGTFDPPSNGNCADWSVTVDSSAYGIVGSTFEKNSFAFSNIGGYGCNFKAALYCVEQP